MSIPSSRQRALSQVSGTPSSSSRRRGADAKEFPLSSGKLPRFFDPCAATASMYLYAQGNSVVCCHHDSLTIERRFSRHSEEVELLAVDNYSEHGAGRLVVSYDAGQTAIVWDLMTGNEVSRFACYEHLTVAAWMRNGNVAFGNTQGSIIRFEPTTSEHVSTRTIDQIAITALAPAADGRTFAIGYQNGSCLVATLEPRFSIIHHLSTARSPSPIVTLQWHASSSRQKSDMLASQTLDGDLRVWSVAKSYNSNEPAKVVRILKRSEDYRVGPNWMAWSKNGRIIQYSETETISWDVRTKHVTHDNIPTLEHVRGLAIYGPGATLFTLGANNTVQQFDLNAPSIMVNNVQHPANLLPPSPPVSIEEQAEKATTIASGSEITFSASDMPISESDEEHLSPFQRLNRTRAYYHHEYVPASYDDLSLQSGESGTEASKQSKQSTGSKTPGRYPSSLRSRGLSENTYISMGATTHQSSRTPVRPSDTYSQSSLSTTSSVSRRRPSRLRNEMPQSDDTGIVSDLFKFTRSRLSDVPYRPPLAVNSTRLTNDDLRRQMLSTIFGWDRDISELIADEMNRHTRTSSSRIMLAKWLGYISDNEIFGDRSQAMTSTDWIILALSGAEASRHNLGRMYVSTLLEKGDVHSAVTILIGLGDHNDAIEIYISHKRFMEALILACLHFPSVWERQEAIVKKWGEWAVQHGQQQLAIRCFSCTGKESSEPWTSPSAAQLTFQSIDSVIPDMMSPPLSPPGPKHGSQRRAAKTGALKLITSFNNDPNAKARFYANIDDGMTPIAAGVTPIAESAVDNSFEPTTAYIQLPNRSAFNTPTSTKSFATGPLGSRPALASIGETQGELTTPPANRERHKRGHSRRASADQEVFDLGTAIERSTTASPMMMRDSYRQVDFDRSHQPPPNPSVTTRLEEINRRNASRDRAPTNLQLNLRGQLGAEVASPDPSATSHQSRYHWPARNRRGPASVSSIASGSTSRSLRSTNNGRPLESYIHSLEAAADYKRRARRHASRDREAPENVPRARSRERQETRDTRDVSEERGRQKARAYPAKSSPTSPVPMSPQELVSLSTPKADSIATPGIGLEASRKKSRTRTSSMGSRRRSPEGRRPTPLDLRGRSQGREPSVIRVANSPPPLISATPMIDDSEDERDLNSAIESQQRFRERHNRSTSRGLGLGAGASELGSPELTKNFEASDVRHRQGSLGSIGLAGRSGSVEHAGDLRKLRDERQRKRDLAARELEAQRRSLAKNTTRGGPVHYADDMAASYRFNAVEASSPPTDLPPRSKTADPTRNFYGRGPIGASPLGLPATPKAMRLVLDSDHSKGGNVPSVPPIPAEYNRSPPSSSPQHSPKKEYESLTLLPSTVYQPPKLLIPRSMSAPIPDEPVRQSSRTGLSRGPSTRKTQMGRRGSQDQQATPLLPPPPSPPAPGHPLLKELQHLATPPPPPPPPLQHAPGGTSNALSSGMIEIVMDDDAAMNEPVVVPPSDMTVPVLSPPLPPSHKGHARGRSAADQGSISGRISKATERLRSASRGVPRDNAMRNVAMEGPPAPYESLPQTTFNPAAARQPIDRSNLPTGLHESEFI